VIKRFYVHNFRCFENFELPIAGISSALLVGKNGAGKSTVSAALEILQKVGRGTSRVRELVSPGDFTRGKAQGPMRFEVDVTLEGKCYRYTLAFEFPDGFRELRVFEEQLTVDEDIVYDRQVEKIFKSGLSSSKSFPNMIDWHLVGLPILQIGSGKDPIPTFKRWLARMLILRPIPSLIEGYSKGETFEPATKLDNFAEWFGQIISFAPSSYSRIFDYLRRIWPDIEEIKNFPDGRESKSLIITFALEGRSIELLFQDLSDGEKCYFISATVIAANAAYGPLLCFWDEPDNHLALSEVGDFAMTLRRSFKASGGQLIATSHNPELIRKFSEDNTFYLYRSSHLEPTRIRPIQNLNPIGDFMGSLLRGDLEP
jgi:predicted ATPase